MAVGNRPESIEDRFRALEDRIKTLETAPRAIATSISEGQVRVLDDDGNVRCILGLLDDGTYGIQLFSAEGFPSLRVNELEGVLASYSLLDGQSMYAGTLVSGSDIVHGMRVRDELGIARFEVDSLVGIQSPGIDIPMYQTGTTPKTITSGTFEAAYQGKAIEPSHGTLWISVPIVADAGTTGEARLSIGGSEFSAVQSIADGFSGTKTWRWLLDYSAGNYSRNINVEVRRTGGGGNIYVYQPSTAALVAAFLGTATGV